MQHEIRWTIPKIRARLGLIAPLVYRCRDPLPPFRLVRHASPEDLPALDADPALGADIGPGSQWVEPEMNFTLLTTFTVPADWPDDLPVALYLPLGNAGDFSHPEARVYVDGRAMSSCDRHHQEVILPDYLRDGEVHTLALHGWTGMNWSNTHWSGPAMARTVVMGACAVTQIDPVCRELIAAARVALETAAVLDATAAPRDRLLNALDAAFRVLDTREPLGDAFYASLPEALDVLATGIGKAGQALDVDIVAVGHAHIDVAWLWTIGQVRHKARRTFANVLRLMEQFPAFRFTQSQPQLYDFVRMDDPELYARIKTRIADGRWEATGGMWVEADCNLSGAESLARQFLLGRQFFREQFGMGSDTPVMWLPDVFGYAWNLPQLIRQAGMEYFFTIKLGWNQYNTMPYDSFWWQGLDGTRVLTHFSTARGIGSQRHPTYNADASPDQTLGAWHHFQQKAQQHTLIMSYGYGDGGGGPTREMLENIGHLRDFPGMPRLQPGRALDFFRQMEAEAGDTLPTWNGELYLEYHRGTYTTQARNKRANRQSEFLLHDAEFLAVCAALLDRTCSYPVAEFRRAWQVVCLNQFHDIIPGSSITQVYADSLAQYARMQADVRQLQADALQGIAARMGGDGLLINPTGFTRSDLAFWPGTLPADEVLQAPDGTYLPAQAAADGTWIALGDLPPYSITPLRRVPRAPGQPEQHTLSVSERHLENALLRVEINDEGDICRILDRRNGRELLPQGAVANQMQIFEDRPMKWDAWDIDIYYDDRMWLADAASSIRVVEQGPLRASLRIERRIMNSRYTQIISLTRDSVWLEVATEIDWQERHMLLKAAFPLAILSPVASYEIQWGHVQRPTHRNTSWDWARFETCAQKWVDLSEGDYGVSLINDGKYGHDIHDNVMRISLLRAPTSPDPTADLGLHHFTYCLLPHEGPVGSETIRAAYALNDPLLAIANSAGTPPAEGPLHLVAADRENIIIETIKGAEDGRGIVVRLYEGLRQRGMVTLRTGFVVAAAMRTNLIEDDGEPIEVLPDGRGVCVAVRPFEIITLRIIPASDA
jgi:alpha-mannosidase